MSILLIRHGETDGNKNRVVQVPATPLNERGQAQAVRLALRLRDAGITRILSSDLARAAMTAEPLERETGLAKDLEPLLQERNFGDLRGQAYASLGFDPMAPGYEPPAGESWEVFHERAAVAWRRVIEARREAQGPIAVVTHGLVCHSLALHQLNLEQHEAPERWGNTSLTEIAGEEPWRVRLLNCVAHLDGEIVDDESLRSGF
jgi:probable phosphoglycerate mutase